MKKAIKKSVAAFIYWVKLTSRNQKKQMTVTNKKEQ
jgi:hypothetical protein